MKFHENRLKQLSSNAISAISDQLLNSPKHSHPLYKSALHISHYYILYFYILYINKPLPTDRLKDTFPRKHNR